MSSFSGFTPLNIARVNHPESRVVEYLNSLDHINQAPKVHIIQNNLFARLDHNLSLLKEHQRIKNTSKKVSLPYLFKKLQGKQQAKQNLYSLRTNEYLVPGKEARKSRYLNPKPFCLGEILANNLLKHMETREFKMRSRNLEQLKQRYKELKMYYGLYGIHGYLYVDGLEMSMQPPMGPTSMEPSMNRELE
jgi:hypothetical protein